jgi:hypothetical protein
MLNHGRVILSLPVYSEWRSGQSGSNFLLLSYVLSGIVSAPGVLQRGLCMYHFSCAEQVVATATVNSRGCTGPTHGKITRFMTKCVNHPSDKKRKFNICTASAHFISRIKLSLIL